MDDDNRLIQTLERIERQQEKLFAELTGLIKDSTSAIVEMRASLNEVRNSLRPPFWKTEGFWIKLLFIVGIFLISYRTVSINGCFEIYDFAVIGCEDKVISE